MRKNIKICTQISNFVVLFIFIVSLIGCGSAQQANTETKYPKTILQYAEYERQNVPKTVAIADQTKLIYEQYLNGRISFVDFQSKLLPLRDQMKTLRDSDDSWYLSHKLTDDENKSDIYNKGLYYGKSLRLNVYSFLFDCSNMKVEDKNQIANLYEAEMVVGYNRKIELVNNAIAKVLVP